MIAAVVKKGISYLSNIEDFDTRMTLLQTLLDTSEGKVCDFVDISLISDLFGRRTCIPSSTTDGDA